MNQRVKNLLATKKSQITIFILIGILLIVGFAILIPVLKGIIKINAKTAIPEINTYINGVHKNSFECTLYALGKGGGFLEFKPHNRSDLEESKIIGEDFLSKIIPKFTDWGIYEKRGDNITEGSISAEIIFAKKNVVGDISRKIKAERSNNNEINLENFHVGGNIRYKHIHTQAEALQNEKDINLNKLADMDLDKNIYIIKDTDVFVFTDKQSILDNKPYKFILNKKQGGIDG